MPEATARSYPAFEPEMCIALPAQEYMVQFANPGIGGYDLFGRNCLYVHANYAFDSSAVGTTTGGFSRCVFAASTQYGARRSRNPTASTPAQGAFSTGASCSASQTISYRGRERNRRDKAAFEAEPPADSAARLC